MWSQVKVMSPKKREKIPTDQNKFPASNGFANPLPPSRECHKYASCVMAFEGAEDVASCRFAKSFICCKKMRILVKCTKDDMTVNLSDAPMASMVMARLPVCLESLNQTK